MTGRKKFFGEFARVNVCDFFQLAENFQNHAPVVVGEVKLSVSKQTRPASSNPAMAFGISTPCRKKQSATIVLVEPTGSLRNRIGCCVVSAPMR